MRKYDAIHKEVERLESEISKLKKPKETKGLDKGLVDKLKGSKIHFGK